MEQGTLRGSDIISIFFFQNEQHRRKCLSPYVRMIIYKNEMERDDHNFFTYLI